MDNENESKITPVLFIDESGIALNDAPFGAMVLIKSTYDVLEAEIIE